MNFLSDERVAIEHLLPGLDAGLASMGLLQAESPDSGAISLFRRARGAALVIPKVYGGLGADAVQAVRVQRAIGSRSPSLAVATTMHHFSVASVVAFCAGSQGVEWLLLRAIAEQGLLLASGFAEGVSGQGILRPCMQAREVPGGLLVNGSKKPCSLSRSMDLLTASVTIQSASGGGSEGRFAVVMISGDSEGIERRPFWSAPVLGAAESDEIVLHDVFVPDRLIFRAAGSVQADPMQGAGFLWFELLVCASYLGIASALVERAIAAGKGTPHQRAQLAMELESAMAAVESVAHTLATGAPQPSDMARALFVRYSVQRAIERASAEAVEIMGGMAFVTSSEIGCLYAASRALAFHPPSRLAAERGLADYLAGGELTLA